MRKLWFKIALHMVTAFGLVALVFMMTMYALERRGPMFVAAFALGCALSSVYGFISGAWPFGSVEAVWCAIVIRRIILDRRAKADTLGERT